MSPPLPVSPSSRTSPGRLSTRPGCAWKASPAPARLTPEQREEALKRIDAGGKDGTCLFCGGLHHGASTPACPRLATFELNGDGQVIKGSFWPEGVSDAAVELDGEGAVRAVTFHQHDEWDTSQIVRAADAAEEEPDGGEAEGA